MQEFFSTGDCGRALALAPASIRRLAKLHILTPIARTASGQHLYDPEQVNALRIEREAARATRDRGRKA